MQSTLALGALGQNPTSRKAKSGTWACLWAVYKDSNNCYAGARNAVPSIMPVLADE